MDRSATRFAYLIESLIAGDTDAESEIRKFTSGWLRQRLFFFRRFWIYGRFRMPVIDRHRYTVGWEFGYPTQKRPSEPPYLESLANRRQKRAQIPRFPYLKVCAGDLSNTGATWRREEASLEASSVLLVFCQIGKSPVTRSRICSSVLTFYGRLSTDPVAPKGLGSQTAIDYDIVPRAYPATDVLTVTMAEAMSEIREVLRSQEAARPIGLTAINFGFSPSFSVAVVCILESPAAPLSTQLVVGVEVPVVVLHGSFEDLSEIDDRQGDTSSVALDAAELVNAGLSGFDLIERLDAIRKLPLPIRAAESPGPIMHGSSIGMAIGMENKGSASVYLTPLTSRNGFDAERSYLLTAAHVVKPDELPADFTITTPGRLDILAILQGAHRVSPTVAESMVLAAKTTCGVVKCGRIGVDDAGYREDWALLELKEPYQGSSCALRDFRLTQIES
jgi:hypothetical protein